MPSALQPPPRWQMQCLPRPSPAAFQHALRPLDTRGFELVAPGGGHPYMRAVTLEPGKPRSQRLQDIAEPPEAQGSILVRSLALGICGTDRELIDGRYGEAAAGHERLVIGHESLGRVITAPAHSGFDTGDIVVGIVRHPDPVPCPNCALGEWDMCRNGRYTERGIKQADGFAAECWRSDPGFTVKVSPMLGLAAVLLEPASVLAKAWEHIERIGRRARWAPQKVLVTGAGPVGLMAALMGMQRGFDVHVMDRNEGGPKPALVKELGATYQRRLPGFEPDIVIECTGSPAVIVQAVTGSPPGSIGCLTRLGGRQLDAQIDIAKLNQMMVVADRAELVTVNAYLLHFHVLAKSLPLAHRAWLD